MNDAKTRWKLKPETLLLHPHGTPVLHGSLAYLNACSTWLKLLAIRLLHCGVKDVLVQEVSEPLLFFCGKYWNGDRDEGFVDGWLPRACHFCGFGHPIIAA